MRKTSVLAALALCAALLLSACGAGGTKAAPSVSAGGDSGEPVGTDSGEPAGTAEVGTEPAEPDGTEPDGGSPEAGLPTAEELDPSSVPPEPEVQEPYDEPDPLDDVTGTWYEDGGAARLVIQEDGSFVYDGTVYYEGTLSYTEEDGEGLWESGPRYEMYLENGERIPETYLTFDFLRPDRLGFVEGGGAVAFVYDGPAPEVQTREVRVRYVTEEELTDIPEYDSFAAYAGDYPVLLLYTAAEPVTDFRVLSISFHDIDDDGTVLYDVEELYDGGSLEMPLLVVTEFPGDLPTNGFSYVDADGVTQYVSVGDSGYDGSVVTGSFTPVQP